MPANWVDINVDGSSMEGYLTRPRGDGAHPAVVVIQEIWGVNSHIQSVADRLPAQGYVGLAPAMFHRQGSMVTGLHEELDTAIGRMRVCTDDGITADVRAAIDYLKSQSYVNDRMESSGSASAAGCPIWPPAPCPTCRPRWCSTAVTSGDRWGTAPRLWTNSQHFVPGIGTVRSRRRQPHSRGRGQYRFYNDEPRQSPRIPQLRRRWPRLPLRCPGAATGPRPPKTLGQSDGLVR